MIDIDGLPESGWENETILKEVAKRVKYEQDIQQKISKKITLSELAAYKQLFKSDLDELNQYQRKQLALQVKELTGYGLDDLPYLCLCADNRDNPLTTNPDLQTLFSKQLGFLYLFIYAIPDQAENPNWLSPELEQTYQMRTHNYLTLLKHNH